MEVELCYNRTMKRNDQNLLWGVLSALGAEVLFGLSYLFTKQISHQVSAVALLGWRFFIAFFVMLLFAKQMGLTTIRLQGKNLWNLGFLVLFCPIFYYIFETLGIGFTTASESGAFLASIPVVNLLVSSLVLKQKPTSFQITGILVTLLGVLGSVFAVGAFASFSLLGYLLLFLAVLSYAFHCVFVEKSSQISGIEMTFLMAGVGFLVFAFLALLQGLFEGNLVSLLALPFQNASFCLAILYQGVGCSVLAFFLSNNAIKKIGVTRTSSFIGISTLVSILSGILFLGETFSHFQVLAAILIIMGVYLSNRG